MNVAGIDGCRAGWVVVSSCGVAVFATLAETLASVADAEIVGLDMPIGLLDAAERGGRACDRAARAVLRPRGCTVFSPPVRAALAAPDYAGALARNRASSPARIGISLQAWNIAGKIAEADALVTPVIQRRVREVHPELAFRAMNDGAPLARRKRDPRGRAERRALLERHGFAPPALLCAGAAEDDVLDAAAVRWTAVRIAAGTAVRLPSDDPPRDALGLFMEIWY